MENCNSVNPNVVTLNRGRSSASVHLFGATLTSWKIDGVEYIFVSKKSLFDGKKAIRGGIPFVFPNFGPWSQGPQHGFARTSKWSLKEEPHSDENGDVTAVFYLTDNEATRAMWNSRFHIFYRVILGEKRLFLSVEVINTDASSFDFTILLHTYFKVNDVTKCTLSNLKRTMYIDKVRNGQQFEETRDQVTVSEFTDRVYKHTPPEHVLSKVSRDQEIKITKDNFPDTVVWNPWAENAKTMSDFGDDEYPLMLCVEPGHVSERIKLDPNEIYKASLTLDLL